MNILYTILIQPIVSIMSFILNIAEPHIGYFLSIITLSFLMSIFLMPIKKMGQKIQDKEIALQYTMYPALLEIKQKYRGEEQFYKIKSLYEHYNYHPIKGLRAMAGLLVQVPFFIGAYHLLSTYTPNIPTAFGDILNLTLADGLLFGINILPFVMAGVTIFIAHKQGIKNPMEKYGLATAFLILLYTSPSSLLIYWTMNLIFSYIIEQVQGQ